MSCVNHLSSSPLPEPLRTWGNLDQWDVLSIIASLGIKPHSNHNMSEYLEETSGDRKQSSRIVCWLITLAEDAWKFKCHCVVHFRGAAELILSAESSTD